jgi:hypothetical protein
VNTFWPAARTEAAAFAAERDQFLGLTGLALDPKKSVLEQAALEIGFKLVFHVPWQRSPLGRPSIPEPGIVLGHELIEQRRFRPMPRIPRRRDETRGLRNVAVRRDHTVRPCTASTA